MDGGVWRQADTRGRLQLEAERDHFKLSFPQADGLSLDAATCRRKAFQLIAAKGRKSRKELCAPLAHHSNASKRHHSNESKEFSMKTKSEIKNGWWMQFKRPIVARIALVAFLAASVRFTVVAQSFYNLDFESATFV